MEAFQDYSYYYNLFYKDKDYVGEAEKIHQLIKKYQDGSEINTILNLGSGTGRHDIELAKLGYHVHGIDLSKQMIELAKEKNQKENMNCCFNIGDVRNYRNQTKYDIIVSLFHVMSYQTQNKDIVQSFATVNAEIKHGGIFLFDAWYGPGVLSDKPSVRIKEIEDEQNSIVRIASPIIYPNHNRVDVCYKVLITNKDTNITSKIEEIHKMRYFFKPEIKEYLEKNELELIDCIDCNTLQEPTFDSWTVYFIVRKK